ncbi:hypothetical protein BRC87_09710 [Halobacteriales archaeon QS_4_66_20]|nr:MAG: hypothetical protein BRC87_09710 [Halobacteriales archaeon QS_4_66_20]
MAVSSLTATPMPPDSRTASSIQGDREAAHTQVVGDPRAVDQWDPMSDPSNVSPQERQESCAGGS